MAGYRLTADADEDFADIYSYSVLTFGVAQADKYAIRLVDGFELLAENSLAGTDYSHVRSDSRRFVHEKHVIYYRLDGESVVILRILSQLQDPLRHL